jgi:hypothetical protein
MTPEQHAQDIVQQLPPRPEQREAPAAEGPTVPERSASSPAGERGAAPPVSPSPVAGLPTGTREETKDILQTGEAGNLEQTSPDGNSAVTFASDAEFAKVLELFWHDARFRATPREHVGGRTIIVPAEVVERLRKENIPFEVHEVARTGDVSPRELSRLRYKNGLMTGLM